MNYLCFYDAYTNFLLSLKPTHIFKNIITYLEVLFHLMFFIVCL